MTITVDMTTMVTGDDNYNCRVPNRLGIMAPSPVANQRMRTRRAFAAKARCAPDKSASSISSHLLTVCRDTRECFASFDAVIPCAIIASWRRAPNDIVIGTQKYCHVKTGFIKDKITVCSGVKHRREYAQRVGLERLM